jgi:SAM-dependent methyltransferase
MRDVQSPNRFIRVFRNPMRGVRWLVRLAKRISGRDITDNGERVDIVYNGQVEFNRFDIYQKSHFRRYQFACSLLASDSIVGDMACGTGYGTAMMGTKAHQVYGYDISPVIAKITKRYEGLGNVFFAQRDLLEIEDKVMFTTIVSFETLEHFPPALAQSILRKFNSLLGQNGTLILSIPYNQEENSASRKHHRSFHINEDVLTRWLTTSGFKLERLFYQNYDSHEIRERLDSRDFMLAVCSKSLPLKCEDA